MFRGTAKVQRVRLPRQTGKYVTVTYHCSTGSRPAVHRRMCKMIPRTSWSCFLFFRDYSRHYNVLNAEPHLPSHFSR